MMDSFWKATACALITAVLYLVISKRDKDLATLLTMAACCMITVVAISYFGKVKSFVYQLQRIANLDGNLLQILFKAVAIGITAGVAERVCADAGNSALGKTLQFLATVMIIVLSLPLMESLLDMVASILPN